MGEVIFMSTQYIRAPFTALTIGSGPEALYYSVPTDRQGEIDKPLALWLESLEGFYSEPEILNGLNKIGCCDPAASLAGLLDQRLIVAESELNEAGFQEDIVILGYGMNPASDCSLAALAVLRDASEVLAFDPPPRIDALRTINPRVRSLEFHFDRDGVPRKTMLENIAHDVLQACKKQKGLVFALYGNARVGCHPVSVLLQLAEKEGLTVRILPGISFFETSFISFDFDPFEGFSFLRPDSVGNAFPSLHTIIGGIGYDLDIAGRRDLLTRMVKELLSKYPTVHFVKVITAARGKVTNFEVPLAVLPLYAESIYPGGTSIYLPPIDRSS